MTDHVYDPTSRQLADITAYAEALSKVTGELKGIGTEDLGEGYRARLGVIPVYTDAHPDLEPLGWLVEGEFSWTFTQRLKEKS